MGSRGVEMIRENFQTQLNRDARYKELKAQGLKLKRTSFGPCELHPMYIKDWQFELTAEDKGFGNGIYKTYFAKIYTVTEVQ